MFRSCQIIIRELCSMLKLYYGIHNSILIRKRGVVAAYRVVWECVVEQWLGVRRVLSNKSNNIYTKISCVFSWRQEPTVYTHTPVSPHQSQWLLYAPPSLI